MDEGWMMRLGSVHAVVRTADRQSAEACWDRFARDFEAEATYSTEDIARRAERVMWLMARREMYEVASRVREFLQTHIRNGLRRAEV
jgi:adenylyl- and sulfurtransferase ThiI